MKLSSMLNSKTKRCFLLLIFFIIIPFAYGFLTLQLNTSFSTISHDFSNKLNLPLYLSDQSYPLLWKHQTGFFVKSVAISADGNYIISGSGYNGLIHQHEINLFYKNDPVPVWTNNSMNGEIFSVAISSNGSYIVAGTGCGFGCDNKVYLFEYQSPSPLWSYQLGDIVFTVAISADGNYIVAGSKDRMVYLFHRSSPIPIWSCHTGLVKSVDISSDGSYIVVGSSYPKLYLFERTSSTPIWSYTSDYVPGYWAAVSSVAISSDGNYIVGGTEVYRGTSRIYFFNRSSSTPLWNYSAEDYVLSVDISSDGNFITAGSEDCNIYLFNKATSTPLWNYSTGAIINSVAISADSNYIAAGTSWPGNSIHVFNRIDSVPLLNFTASEAIFSVGISSYGNLITAGGIDGHVRLFGYNILSLTNGNDQYFWIFLTAIFAVSIVSAVLIWNYIRKKTRAKESE